MAYARTYTIDSGPSGDTVKAAIGTKLDGDLTNIFSYLNTHDTATTGVHGLSASTVVGTATSQTLTNKTISGAILTGTTTATGATITGGTVTGGTISGVTLTGTVTGTSAILTAATLTGTITASGSTIISPTITAATLANPVISLASSADGDIYYQASSKVARLAKGAANTHLVMNAGATAPEWAAPYKIINSSRDMAAASGDVAYTGVGFKPSLVEINLVQSNLIHSHGSYDGTSYTCWYSIYTGAWSIATNIIASCNQGASPDRQTAVVASLDDDGLTLTWTKQGTTSGTIIFSIKCYR